MALAGSARGCTNHVVCRSDSAQQLFSPKLALEPGLVFEISPAVLSSQVFKHSEKGNGDGEGGDVC